MFGVNRHQYASRPAEETATCASIVRSLWISPAVDHPNQAYGDPAVAATQRQIRLGVNLRTLAPIHINQQFGQHGTQHLNYKTLRQTYTHRHTNSHCPRDICRDDLLKRSAEFPWYLCSHPGTSKGCSTLNASRSAVVDLKQQPPPPPQPGAHIVGVSPVQLVIPSALSTNSQLMLDMK